MFGGGEAGRSEARLIRAYTVAVIDTGLMVSRFCSTLLDLLCLGIMPMSSNEDSPNEECGAWLREKRMARQHQVPFMVRWVHDFLRLRQRRPAEAWRDSLEVFLEDLSEGRVPGWQVRQAGEAVRLYCGPFGGLGEDPSAGRFRSAAGRCSSASGPFRLRQVLPEMERLLVLRHYAPSTRRSYLHWAGRYVSFLGQRTRTCLPRARSRPS